MLTYNPTTVFIRSLFILILLFFASRTFSQTTSISGVVQDTMAKKPLANASILLLRAKDSIMIIHCRTGSEGKFLATRVPPGSYMLLVTYPAFADYIDSLVIKDSAGPIVLPFIPMIPKSALLEQVVVRGGQEAVRLKGDTTEFKADSFHTQAGATVEDLLKKLPGIQVDRNGKITAQGETVKKVLVDGEEFFGDDPTLVTQNLRADMVDKVQVYDKKSEQSAFTGIDDGQRDKTINLKLKDNKKNGYFGRATAGVGTDGFYDGQLMLNAFRKKQKLALYGIASNTGKTGLNWDERDKYGQSFAGSLDVDETTGNLSFERTSDDLDSWDGRYGGQGLPSVITGGLHYNDKLNDDRTSLNGNYKYMDLKVNGTNTTDSRYILPDTLYYNHEQQKFNNQIFRHSGNGNVEIKLDSTSTLKIKADGGTDHKISNNAYESESLASDSSIVNNNKRTVSDVADNVSFNSNLIWQKKLPKKGRTLSVSLRENYSRDNSSGYLLSNTELYSGGNPVSDSIVDQYKNNRNQHVLWDGKISYTEPLSTHSALIVNYGLFTSNTNSLRNSYNRDASGKYTQQDSLYSNHYQFNVLTQKGGLSYNLIKGKLRFNAGNSIGFTGYKQEDLIADTSISRHFINWFPHASVGYSFSGQKRLNIEYNGQTSQPSIDQLQPVRVNEDPLNISIGNPGLKPRFQNSFRLFFMDYKILTDRNIYSSISYDFTHNDISSSVNVDSSGRRVTQSINVNGNYNLSAYVGFGFKWKKPDLRFSFNGNFNQSNNVSEVNNQMNQTQSGNYTLGSYISKYKEKKFDIGLSTNATFTHSRSSVNANLTTDYWTYEISPSLDVFLPLKFQIHGDVQSNLRPKTNVFNTSNNVTLLNAWIGKKFLKNDALLIKAAGNDLLDQNNGFSRSVNSNFITQNTYTTIRRYFLFSVVWNFNKAGAAPPAGGN